MTPGGQHGGLLEVGLRVERLVVAIVLTGTVPRALEQTEANVSLARLGAAMRVAYFIPVATGVALVPSLAVGAVGYLRSTTDAVSGVEAEADALIPSILLSPGLDLVVELGGPMSVFLRAAADIVPGAPTIGYDRGTEFVSALPLWNVTPSLALGLLASFR